MSVNHSNKKSVETAQSRLALITYLTQKNEGSTLFKKKSLLWDHERLYSENLELRAQIKQLSEANIKARTIILQMESQIKVANLRNSDHTHSYKQSITRSFSLRNISKRSLTTLKVIGEEAEQSKSIRQMIRELKEEIGSLKNENSQLKHSLKYTRMNELQCLNKEMQAELQRLNRIASQTRSKYYDLTIDCDYLKAQMKRQSDAKRLAQLQRDKTKRECFELRRSVEEMQRSKQKSKRKLKSINPQSTHTFKIAINKMDPQSFNSIPKLQYSISGLERLENDTINFDRLVNTDSEFKSIPKITSIELLNKDMITPQPARTPHPLDFSPKYEEDEQEYLFQDESDKQLPTPLTKPLAKIQEKQELKVVDGGGLSKANNLPLESVQKILRVASQVEQVQEQQVYEQFIQEEV